MPLERELRSNVDLGAQTGRNLCIEIMAMDIYEVSKEARIDKARATYGSTVVAADFDEDGPAGTSMSPPDSTPSLSGS